MTAIPIDTAATSPKALPIQFLSQEDYINLCWAACSAMVTKAAANAQPGSYGTLPQTVQDIAETVQNAPLTGRCALGAETDGRAPFDQTLYPDCALHDVLKLPCIRQQGTLYDDDLMAEMNERNSPVIVEIQWDSGGSHVVLLRGYSTYPNGTIFYDVCDPKKEAPVQKNRNGLCRYDGVGSWQATYLQVGISL